MSDHFVFVALDGAVVGEQFVAVALDLVLGALDHVVVAVGDGVLGAVDLVLVGVPEVVLVS